MKKLITLALTLFVTAGLLAGCSSKPKEVDKGELDKSQQLIIYTNSGTNGRDEWLANKAKEGGYNVQVVNIGGADLTNRLIAEKNNSQADLVFGLNSIEYEKLKKEDLLLKYEPTWISDVDKTLGDPEGFYHPIVIQPLVLMHNTDLANPPKDWTDLVDVQYKDKFTLLNLGGGTGKTIYASILARYLDEKGDLGVSQDGWDMVKKIFDNGHIADSSEDYVGNAIDGTRPMTTMWGSGVLQNQTERNYTFDIMSPEVGVPYVVEQTAIISKTKKAALAEDFINWFGSAKIQEEWSTNFGTIAASKTAQEKASKDIKDFMAKVHPQDIDWGVVAENIDKWVEKAELEFIK